MSDAELWDQVARQFLAERRMTSAWPMFREQALFEFRFDLCLVTLTVPDEGLPAGHTVWRPAAT